MSTWKERTALYMGIGRGAPGTRRNAYLRVTAPLDDSSVGERVAGIFVLVAMMFVMIYAAITTDFLFWRIVVALGFVVILGAFVLRLSQLVEQIRD